MTVVTSFNDCKNARTTKAMLTNRPASGTPPIKDSTERDCILFRLSTNTAPDSRVSFVVCHMILDSRDFTLNLNCTTSAVQIYLSKVAEYFRTLVLAFKLLWFPNLRPLLAFCLCQAPSLSMGCVQSPSHIHPILSAPCERKKESQHELLIFPPLFEFCKQEGGKWNTLGELGYPIEMLGFSQHYLHKGSPTPALLLYCHVPRLFCKHFNVTT